MAKDGYGRKQEKILEAQTEARRSLAAAKQGFGTMTKGISSKGQAYKAKRNNATVDRKTSADSRRKIEAERRGSLMSNKSLARRQKTIASIAAATIAAAPLSQIPGQYLSEPAAIQGAQIAGEQIQDRTAPANQSYTVSEPQPDNEQEAMMGLAMASAQQQASVASINQGKQGSSNLQEQAQKQAKKTVMDSVGFVMEGIADALDLGTGSITMVVNFAEHAFFVVWTHLRLFVYYWDYEGTSRLLPLRQFITPLEASVGPLSLNKIIPPTWIHVGLIMFDIFLIILVIIFLGFGLLILMAYVNFMSDPIGSIMGEGLSNSFGIVGNLLNFVK